MLYAIDKRNNEIILACNIKTNNYKDTYNNNLRWKCADNACNDNNLIFINSLHLIPHFRHSYKSDHCSVSKSFSEYNKDFYNNWYKLFK